jgi:hypothetical protein
MTISAAALTLDLLDWLAGGPRPYAEVMEVWRTSCPRLTVWEDAIDAGLVAHLRDARSVPLIGLTPRGRALLTAHRRRLHGLRREPICG